jgi:hypothetical protein
MYIRIYIYINICKNKTYLLRSFRAMHKKTRFDEILRLQVAYISMLRYVYIYIYTSTGALFSKFFLLTYTYIYTQINIPLYMCTYM